METSNSTIFINPFKTRTRTNTNKGATTAVSQSVCRTTILSIRGMLPPLASGWGRRGTRYLSGWRWWAYIGYWERKETSGWGGGASCWASCGHRDTWPTWRLSLRRCCRISRTWGSWPPRVQVWWVGPHWVLITFPAGDTLVLQAGDKKAGFVRGIIKRFIREK